MKDPMKDPMKDTIKTAPSLGPHQSGEPPRHRRSAVSGRTNFPRLLMQSDVRRAPTGRPARWGRSLQIFVKALLHCRLACRSRG